MTKRIIFIFAALCSLQARASVRPAQADTVRYTSFTDAAELLQPVQPTHLDGVILPMRGSGNWFVGIAGGSTAFLGTLLGCEDCSDASKHRTASPSASGSRPRSAHGSITADRASRTPGCPHRGTTMSMRICCGMFSAAGMPGRSRCAGGSFPLRASACCIMLRTGTTRLRSPTAYRGSTASPEG